MNRKIFALTFAAVALSIISTLAAHAQSAYIMDVTINGHTLQARMEANQATAQLISLLEKGDITVNLHAYGGFERVGSLPQSLTTSDKNINATTGDIVLYLGNQIVFMLGSNSWSYTRLGHIDADRATLEAFFGSGNSTAILSIPQSSVDPVTSDNEPAEYFDLQGNKITGQPHGLVIKKQGDKITKVHKK